MDQTDNFDIADKAWTTTQERNRDVLHQWCDLATGVDAIKGQWKASILATLRETACNLTKLQQRLAPANRRVLVRALRELEADKLINRIDGDNVTYKLTKDGRDLSKIPLDRAAWQKARI